MALVADAGHNLSDVLGLMVGLGWGDDGPAGLRRRRALPTGWKKASILVRAHQNALFLLIAVGAIGAEAIRRLFHPHNHRWRDM